MNQARYRKVQEIIRNVIRDNNYNDLEITYLDALEWAAESIELIGAPKAYIDDISCITIKDYRGVLPCNFHQMTQCSGSINGSVQFPMKGSTNTFHPVFTCDDKQLTNLSTNNSVYINSDAPIGTDVNGNEVFNFIGSNTDYTAMPPSTNANSIHISDATYKLNDNYMFTSFPKGRVYLAYKAFPVDQDGFPKIPDNIKFVKAVESYIRYKIDYRMWRKGDIDDKVFKKSEQEWLWYCGSAGTSMRIPTIDQMESIKDQFLHLIPRLNLHADFFRTLNQQEQLVFANKNYYTNLTSAFI